MAHAPRRLPDRVKYRARIRHLLDNPPDSKSSAASESEMQAHWAKYVCVLVSGYLEQSLKEIFLEHATAASQPRVARYIERTWPVSKNMKCDAIEEILINFDDAWAKNFNEWYAKGERKKEINEIIAWRNNIAHGKEPSTNNVTIVTVKQKYKTACDLVDLLEKTCG